MGQDSNNKTIWKAKGDLQADPKASKNTESKQKHIRT